MAMTNGLHVNNKRMVDFLQNCDFIACVLHLLQPDYVHHGKYFQGEWLATMSAEHDPAECACAWKLRISVRLESEIEWNLMAEYSRFYPSRKTSFLAGYFVHSFTLIFLPPSSLLTVINLNNSFTINYYFSSYTEKLILLL